MIKIETENAPKAIGPYSQAVRIRHLLFVSGQLPLNPQTGKIEEVSIEGQTRQVLANIKAILHAGDCSMDDVVRTEVYLKDLQDFAAIVAPRACDFGLGLRKLSRSLCLRG